MQDRNARRGERQYAVWFHGVLVDADLQDWAKEQGDKLVLARNVGVLNTCDKQNDLLLRGRPGGPQSVLYGHVRRNMVVT